MCIFMRNIFHDWKVFGEGCIKVIWEIKNNVQLTLHTYFSYNTWLFCMNVTTFAGLYFNYSAWFRIYFQAWNNIMEFVCDLIILRNMLRVCYMTNSEFWDFDHTVCMRVIYIPNETFIKSRKYVLTYLT